MFEKEENRFDVSVPWFPEEGEVYLIHYINNGAEHGSHIKCYALCVTSNEDHVSFKCGIFNNTDLIIDMYADDEDENECVVKFTIKSCKNGRTKEHNLSIIEGDLVADDEIYEGDAYRLTFGSEDVVKTLGVSEINAIIQEISEDRKTVRCTTHIGTLTFIVATHSNIVIKLRDNELKEHTCHCYNRKIGVYPLV